MDQGEGENVRWGQGKMPGEGQPARAGPQLCQAGALRWEADGNPAVVWALHLADVGGKPRAPGNQGGADSCGVMRAD